jgi:dihydrofolate reductase
MTVDGYIAGTNGEMDWMEWNWDDELKQFVKEITEPVDCIILGRKLAEGFIPYRGTVLQILMTRNLQLVRNLPTQTK